MKPSNDAGILIVPGDIAERKTAERAISEGIARFGRIDSLVNNAGIFIAKPFTQYTQADYAAILGVNVAGFFHMTQLAVADFVIHSTTKYLNGHSDVVGGAVIAAERADLDALSDWATLTGVRGAPFDSYLTLRGPAHAISPSRAPTGDGCCSGKSPAG
jgi:NAD(P)-dependent dehydrogenase (short-subunit alcohol dehydrogenase family)